MSPPNPKESSNRISLDELRALKQGLRQSLGEGREGQRNIEGTPTHDFGSLISVIQNDLEEKQGTYRKQSFLKGNLFFFMGALTHFVLMLILFQMSVEHDSMSLVPLIMGYALMVTAIVVTPKLGRQGYRIAQFSGLAFLFAVIIGVFNSLGHIAEQLDYQNHRIGALGLQCMAKSAAMSIVPICLYVYGMRKTGYPWKGIHYGLVASVSAFGVISLEYRNCSAQGWSHSIFGHHLLPWLLVLCGALLLAFWARPKELTLNS